MPPSEPVKVFAEYAKSKRSSCKKCSQFIQAKTMRLGLLSKDRLGFDMTKWHHLDCFSEKVETTEEIIGFASLKENDQEALKKLISGVKDVVEGSLNSVSKVVIEMQRTDESEEEHMLKGKISKTRKKMVENGEELEEKISKISKNANENKDEFELEEETSKKKKRTYEIREVLTNPAMPPSNAVKILAEYAKSKRSSCTKCSQFIQAKTLRLGLVCKDRLGFDRTKWHHLDCFSEKVESTKAIIGFASLKENDQEALKKLASGFKSHVDVSANANEDEFELEEETSKKKKASKKMKRTYEIREGLTNPAMPPSNTVKILAEYAKSKMSSCTNCFQFIQAKTLRLGLVCKDWLGFDRTKWHHLDCFSEKVESTKDITGFASLKENDQEALKKLISGVNYVVEGTPNSASKRTDESEDELKLKGKISKPRKKTVENGEELDLEEKISKISKSANENEDEFELEEETSKKMKRTYKIKEGLTNPAMPPNAVKILAEYAKSKMSSCMKCSQFIQAKTLRLGLVCKDRLGFDRTKWHHLDCFSEKVELTKEIIGFASLKISGAKDVVEGNPDSASKRTYESGEELELKGKISKKRKKMVENEEEVELEEKISETSKRTYEMRKNLKIQRRLLPKRSKY
ncbi:polynucleotide 3'-phosphatase ZDP-like isoform X2 [Euphorbia lathyris]|uniref:polynucleotide 3'-phosphatase ZDP-like isoform X2 n=1 Tax=Euphorbia lathyris TaxID=212925 RepID=UPI0033135C19